MTNEVSGRIGFPALTFLCVVAVSTPAVATDWIGEYFPMALGNTWIYQNFDVPGDFLTESVFELIDYDGQAAVRFGTDPDNHTILSNTGHVVTVFAEIDEGVVIEYADNVQLGAFEDGELFEICTVIECDTLFVRDWDALDPALRAIYEIDPGYTDLLLFVSYDRSEGPNFHNTIATSNLPAGITPPTGAVVYLEWYQRDLGPIAQMGIDAASGGVEDYYVLWNYIIPVPETSVVSRTVVLEPNVPNPFNPATEIRFEVPAGGPALLQVFDLRGRLITTLMDRNVAPGSHEVVWNGRDDALRDVPSGVYLSRLRAGGRVVQGRMTLAR